MVRMRPVSVVVEDEETAEWLEIPNTTGNILSTMAVAAMGIAAVSAVILVIAGMLKRNERS